MDPNANLATLRSEVADILTYDSMTPRLDGRIIDAAIAVAETFVALDGWLAKGGFLPDAWQRKSPAYGENPKLDQLFLNTFVTALEGGIGYWAASTSYHWEAKGDLMGEDLKGFYSDIVDTEFPDDEDNAGFQPVRIDRAVIARGFDRLLAGSIELNPSILKNITAAYHDPDNADLDAEDADVIVQVGLFGEIVYG